MLSWKSIFSKSVVHLQTIKPHKYATWSFYHLLVLGLKRAPANIFSLVFYGNENMKPTQTKFMKTKHEDEKRRSACIL